MKNNNNVNIEFAEESYMFGVDTTYDGDKHNVLFGSECSHCGEYFESIKITLYCNKCIDSRNGN